MRFERVRVERLAAQVPLLREQLGRDPLRHDLESVRDLIGDRSAVRPHRDAGHHLDPGRHDQVELSRHHRRGAVEVRLHRRPTLAVDRRAADLDRPSRGEHRHPADVPPLLADLRHAPHLHVLDLGRIEVDTADEPVQDLRRKVVSAQHRQRPVPAPDRRANSIDDVAVHPREPSRAATARRGGRGTHARARARGFGGSRELPRRSVRASNTSRPRRAR